jgi:hypothetical protein
VPSATIITTVDPPVHLFRNVAGNAHPLIRWTTILIIRAQIRPCAFWMSIFEPRNFQPTVMVRPSPGRAEHLTSLHIASRIPACNICSKCHGVQEHIYHVSDFTDVPTRNILVEGAKGLGVLHHLPIFRHFFHFHKNPSSSVISGTNSREIHFPPKPKKRPKIAKHTKHEPLPKRDAISLKFP